MSLANSIRELREQLGVSSTQLAYLSGLQQSTVVRLEHSERSATITLQSMERLAQALGYKLQYSFVTADSSRAVDRRSFPSRDKGTSKGRRAESAVMKRFDKEYLEMLRAQSPTERIQRVFDLRDFQRSVAKSHASDS